MSAKSDSSGIGEPVRRMEDFRLLTGRGRYADDLTLENQCYAVMVRSPHAHARIRAVDRAKAMAVPGVIAVLTGQDLLDDRLRSVPNKTFSLHPAEQPLVNKDGSDAFTAPDYPLPADKTRYVGEAVVMVVAETVASAKDGAERVTVTYDPLPCVVYTVAAAGDDAPLVHDESHSNICIDAEVGDAAATAAAFARAAHIARFHTWVPRVTGVPMEPRTAVGDYDARTGRYTIYTGSGATIRLMRDIAHVLNVPEANVRLVIRDVGGNFGTRGAIYPEFPLVAWAARRVGRPVKWRCERSESFLTDYQGRDLAVEAELALDADGTFLAMRGSNIGNLGSHTGNFSMVQKGVEIMTSIYHVPAAHFRVRAVMSNTAPTRPYRSAGRPEVIFVMERLIDLAAAEFAFDRVALRRRNLVPEAAMPYTNPFGMIYDSGTYHDVMETVLRAADWDGFPARRAAARAHGKHRGIGVANYVDTATGVPREKAIVTVQPDGWVDLVIGTISNGQGHETSFAQLVGEWLGVPVDRVRLITGDTDIVKVGGGTHSGRGMRLGSIVIWKASTAIIARGREIAALLMQVAPEDITFADGRFTILATGRSIGLFELAGILAERPDVPEELRGDLSGECDETIDVASFP
jgi:carbon-monoxide dehydrogenase large subunit